MPEQINRPNPWRKMMMMMMTSSTIVPSTFPQQNSACLFQLFHAPPHSGSIRHPDNKHHCLLWCDVRCVLVDMYQHATGNPL
jgi:hypothetical protein